MTNNYQYSIKVNEALERYGAKTCGTLERRVERLKRFTELKNKQYAAEVRLEDARMVANQEREERVKNRVREIYEEQRAPVFLRRNLRRNLDQEFLNTIDKREEALEKNRSLWVSTGKAKEGRRYTIDEACQTADVPMTPSRYNLRPRPQSETGLNALWQAIQNGFVIPNRGWTPPQ